MILRDLIPTSQKPHHVFVTKENTCNTFTHLFFVNFENHAESTNTVMFKTVTKYKSNRFVTNLTCLNATIVYNKLPT
jgi:hypothetical protein